MLPTFVIGLREGLEAALIIGIIATFLAQQNRRDALRAMWIGVGIALTLCAGVAVALKIAEENLPQRQQEGLETVIGLLAVGMVTWMIVWMRRHARGLKGDLEGKAAAALLAGSVGTLVLMAFLAVLREGLETAVFLLAAFQAARDPSAAGTGAVLGIIVAVAIGYGIYRGGVKLNLERFFKLTGFVLVLVAAGLLATAAHTAHEAGWLNSGQAEALSLQWLVDPGSIRSALLTGMLGIQPQPVAVEVIVWLAYAIPMGVFVLWPSRPRSSRARKAAVTAGVGAALVAVLALAGCGSSGSGSASGDDTGIKQVSVKLVDSGCDPANLSAPAGPTKFNVSNDDADAVTEFEVQQGGRIAGEVELVAPGFSKSFSMTLKPGKYTIQCNGGSKNDGKGKLTVTGTAKAATAPNAAARVAAVGTYRTYLEQQANLLVARTTPFVAAVKAGDVDQAKSLYAAARTPYERIEPVAESYGELDPRIDARVNDVAANKWSGFHKIEQALYENGNLDGMGPVADQLLTDVTTVQSLVKTVKVEPATIANGAVELLNEVSSSKITGEEERYSHIDLVDLAANVDGSRAAFDAVAPLVPAGSPVSAADINAKFDAINAALAPYKQGDTYVLYTTLTKSQTRAIAQTIDAAAEPLSQVAEQVVA
ncbi:MAG TPA: iron uptake system protein EfeO [Acidimicrobiia bacterium]|jgi:high-affinity iron transporter